MESLTSLDRDSLHGRRILLRVDFNVSADPGSVGDVFRLTSSDLTIDYLRSVGAKIVLLSHWGRPGGKVVQTLSFQRIIPVLDALHPDLRFIFSSQSVGQMPHHFIQNAQPHEIVLLENLRFYPEEEVNDLLFAQQLADLGDIYVNDALSICHRTHASVVGVPRYRPGFCGLSLHNEVDQLTKLFQRASGPLMAIVGGSKISTKLPILRHLVEKVDYLAVGGAMANTFLKAQGVFLGESLWEEGFVEAACHIEKIAQKSGCCLLLPQDVFVQIRGQKRLCALDKILPGACIKDIGTQTLKRWLLSLAKAKTLVWNGPVGVVEEVAFQNGTRVLAQRIAQATREQGLNSVVGGGDTVAALQPFDVLHDLTHVSSAGGGFLKWLEGGSLPGLQNLKGSCL